MTNAAPLQTAAVATKQPGAARLTLQRKCACGARASALTGECTDCGRKRVLGVQTRLRIGDPGDRFEREAERVADAVMEAQAAPPCCTRIDPPRQRKGDRDEGTAELSDARFELEVDAARGRGTALPAAESAFMASRLGFDLSRVRIHADAAAARLSAAIGAQAFTVGGDVFFDAGAYAPGTTLGRRLIAHELAHVAQQGAAPPVAGAQSMRFSVAPAGLVERAPAATASPPASPNLQPCDPASKFAVREAVGAAQRRAGEVAERLDTFRRPKVRRVFRRIFGDKSAAARSAVLAPLQRIARLELSWVSANWPKEATTGDPLFLGCPSDQQADCVAGADAFYLPPEGDSPHSLWFCPKYLRDTNGAVITVEPGSAPALAREFTALHEMLHMVLSPGAVDVYLGSRLFPLLKRIERTDATNLSLATVNPDSIVLFVYQSLATEWGVGGGVNRQALADVVPSEPQDQVSGFGTRPARRAARVAIGVAEQWLQRGQHDLSVLHEALFGLNPGASTWSDVSSADRGTAALLGGGAVDSAGGTKCGTSVGFTITCPTPTAIVAQADLDLVEKERSRVEALMGLLRQQVPVPSPTAGGAASPLHPHGGALTEPRTVGVRRTRQAPAARFEPSASSGRLELPQSFSGLSTVEAQARTILRALVAQDGGGDVDALVSFLVRNGARADIRSTAAFGPATKAPPQAGRR